jgi:hypothetical protein
MRFPHLVGEAIKLYKFALKKWLGEEYGNFTGDWQYYVELDGVENFLSHIASKGYPSIFVLNMQGKYYDS